MYQIGSLEMWKGDFSHRENSSQFTGGPFSHPLNIFMSNNFKNVSPNVKKSYGDGSIFLQGLAQVQGSDPLGCWSRFGQ